MSEFNYENEQDYGQPSFTINECNLYLTCVACPEQYDVFYKGKMIGYLRLRHGNFSATYPDVFGKLVYFASPKGNGMFEEEERLPYLFNAVQALLNERNRNVEATN